MNSTLDLIIKLLELSALLYIIYLIKRTNQQEYFTMRDLAKVMTATEAAEKWGKAPITIQQACTVQKGAPPRFTEDECRKAGRIWLVTYAGMVRLYGEPK